MKRLAVTLEETNSQPKTYIITAEQLNIIATSITDASSFYEMFNEWEGVLERVTNLDLAWSVLQEIPNISH
jgi:hypothetical protein